MSLIARHKKPGGFRKLVNSLETTVVEKRVKIHEALRAEDPDFIAEIEQSIFNFEEFIEMDDLIVCEVVGALSKEMRTLALALYKSPDERLVQKFFKNMRKAAGTEEARLWAISTAYVVGYMVICAADNLTYYLVFNWYVWFFIGLSLVFERFSKHA